MLAINNLFSYLNENVGAEYHLEQVVPDEKGSTVSITKLFKNFPNFSLTKKVDYTEPK